MNSPVTHLRALDMSDWPGSPPSTPLGSDVHNVTAAYRNGVLTVRIGLSQSIAGAAHAVLVDVQ